MTSPTKEELVTFTAILEEFAAAERARALTETRKQRISVARHVGDQNIAFEIVVDEGASAEVIFDILAPLDGAIDRLKAKADLSDHYMRMANHCGQIEMSVKKAAADRQEFARVNNSRSRRREEVGLTEPQRRTLEAHRLAIADGFERIEELKKAATECRRVLDGEDPFKVLDDLIEGRLDQLRGARQHAA